MKAPERAKNHILYGWDGWGETRPPLIYRLKRISPTRYEDDIVDVDNDKWSASASEAERSEFEHYEDDSGISCISLKSKNL